MAGREKLLAGVGIALIVTVVAMMFVYQVIKPSNPMSPGGGGGVAAGRMAAPFALEDLNGRLVTLADLRGKVVFLNVWATWCGPCREEMPSIEALYDEFKDNKDFVILAVSQDTRGREAVEPYVERNGYHFEVLLDPENKVGESYDVGGVPETFIIDRDGRIVAHHMGAFDWSSTEFRAALEDLLHNKEKITS